MTPAEREILIWAIRQLDSSPLVHEPSAFREASDEALRDWARCPAGLDMLRREILLSMATDGALWRSTKTMIRDLRGRGLNAVSDEAIRRCASFLCSELKLLERTTFKEAYGSGVSGRGWAWRLAESAHKITKKYEPRDPHAIKGVTVSAGEPVARVTVSSVQYWDCPFCAWDAQTPCPAHEKLCVYEGEELCGKTREAHGADEHDFVGLEPETVEWKRKR